MKQPKLLETETRHCPACRRETEHVKRVRWERPELFEGMHPVSRLVVVCVECGREGMAGRGER